MTDQVVQRFSVDFDFPVFFTRNLFSEENATFVKAVTRLEPEKRHRVLFVIDENILPAHPRLISQIDRYFAIHSTALENLGPPVPVQGGEASKNDFGHVLRVAEEINDRGLDRQSIIAVIGGGAVLDMACFVGAIAHRGVRTIRIPTSVLSQGDSGVGVKNGVNWFGKKNYFGTFVPPFAVINDEAFLDTLEPRDKIAGLAEAVKVSLIRDKDFYDYLETNVSKLTQAEPDTLVRAIRRTAELHLKHIGTSGDPFEFGSARPLDFGHWAAHKLETMTGHRLRHGEAVAIGMALDCIYSTKLGFLRAASTDRILNLLEALGFKLWDETLLQRDFDGSFVVLKGLQEFREHLGGALHITLLREIGTGFEVNEIRQDVVLDAIDFLKMRFERKAVVVETLR